MMEERTNRPRVLIVEDSATIRSILSQQLEEQGMVVSQAEDGKIGLEAAVSGNFDLVISDVDMPFLDGFALCREIKKNPRTRGTPVIILSSLDSDRDIDRGFQVGASAYISKAAARRDLNRTIEQVLDDHHFSRNHLIMVVDDSSIVRSMVKKRLQEAGFRVDTANNGKIALEASRSCRPDLILSDIDMPEMNGIDLCKALRNTDECSATPFVVMSANSDRAVMRRMLNWGAAAYLVKPFNLEQLVITIEKLLSNNFLLMLKDRQRLEAEQKMLLAGITSLITALEARDHYTRGHSEAVASMVQAMAAHMDIDQDHRESLVLAVRLHDIGKIGIPDSILLKPDRLSGKEYSIIKQHPVMGTRILGEIPSMRNLLPVIRHHHERFDGRGYPDGLAGEHIPLWARLASVADAYDALTSDRPYRKGVPRDQALQVIDDVRGSQLCPDCVAVFFEVIGAADSEPGVASVQEKNGA